MKALFEARLEDLGPSDPLRIECICGHSEQLTAAMLATAGVKPYEVLVALGPKLRCRECDERGKVVVSIRWGALDYETDALSG